MSPELWVGAIAVFVSGGAIGASGILLAQWLVRKVDLPAAPKPELHAGEMDVLRGEVAEISRHLRNLDARLDFTEQLLDGALPLAPPPPRLEDSSGDDAPEG